MRIPAATANTLEPAPARRCRVCGIELSSPRADYCSRRCRKRAYAARRRDQEGRSARGTTWTSFEQALKTALAGEDKTKEPSAAQEPAEMAPLPTTLRTRVARPFAKHRRPVRILGVLGIAVLVLALVRLSAIFGSANDQLLVRVGNEAPVVVDLRQGTPISPYLIGANVFPEATTSSADANDNGFMSYGPAITDGLRQAKVKLLRFPGGSWGEEHLLSYEQLNAYSALLAKTGAQGMIQARLSGSMGSRVAGLDSLADRANLAGRWVDYMNNPRSSLRTGANAQAPFHPVKFWTVGNEPDLLVNPDTGQRFTVEEYVRDFVQYSTAMHENNPTIQVFGPEISQFNGVGAGPTDRGEQLWMEDFLKGVGAYERAHPELKFHLLDGVSFHFYPGAVSQNASATFLTNANVWNYLLASLRQLVRQTLDRDAPVAVTEINSSATMQAPAQGPAALWWADTLGALMNQEVGYVAFFAAEGVDSPYPLFTTDQLRPTSMLRVLQLFAHLQSQLIPVASQRDPISVHATQDQAHQTVSLLFVNKATGTQLAQVSPQNQVLGISSWAGLDISLSPFSITAVTLHRGGGAEAYSFKVQSSDDASLAPLVRTLCGHKADALAYEIPC